jgi:5-formyltetrahydrofolate cyclo-ligase
MPIPENPKVIQPPEIAEQKHQLRLACRKIRQELGGVARHQASMSICAHIESWSVFERSSLILAYMPTKDEVDLTSLLARHPEKHWVLPRILPDENHRIVFHLYDCDRLFRHPFGMQEPAPDLPVIPSSDIHLALVPGLAFDYAGRRLGYGGGYFDRFLCDFTGISLGITFHALLLDQLPRCEHDQPVQWIVTELGIIPACPPPQ